MTAEMTTQLIVIIAILVTAIFSGAPVMAAIGGTAVFAMIFFFEVPFFDHFARMAYQSATRAEFLISPLFLLMSEFLSKGGLAEDIFAVMHKLMNRIKGGLAMATTLACTIFAALCGSSPATAASVGVIATEAMTKRKYRKDFAIGTVAGGDQGGDEAYHHRRLALCGIAAAGAADPDHFPADRAHPAEYDVVSGERMINRQRFYERGRYS